MVVEGRENGHQVNDYLWKHLTRAKLVLDTHFSY